MSSNSVFISHASKDDGFVKDLRQALEGQGIQVWADSRNLRGGDKLKPEIDQAIEQARQVLVVLSPNMTNSSWVRKEIQKALEVEKQHLRRSKAWGSWLSSLLGKWLGRSEKDNGKGFCVIPLLLPGIGPSALGNWFAEEPVGVPISLEAGGVQEARYADNQILRGRKKSLDATRGLGFIKRTSRLHGWCSQTSANPKRSSACCTEIAPRPSLSTIKPLSKSSIGCSCQPCLRT